MCHQKLHLIGQDSAVSQNEIFPQAGYVRGEEQWHACLLRCSAAFAVVA